MHGLGCLVYVPIPPIENTAPNHAFLKPYGVGRCYAKTEHLLRAVPVVSCELPYKTRVQSGTTTGSIHSRSTDEEINQQLTLVVSKDCGHDLHCRWHYFEILRREKRWVFLIHCCSLRLRCHVMHLRFVSGADTVQEQNAFRLQSQTVLERQLHSHGFILVYGMSRHAARARLLVGQLTITTSCTVNGDVEFLWNISHMNATIRFNQSFHTAHIVFFGGCAWAT